MIEVYHAGAGVAGNPQLDARLSLGGFLSGTRCSGLEARRAPRYAVAGLRVSHVSGANGLGLGLLLCPTASTVRWKAPGALEAGAAVEIAAGGSAVVYGYDSTDKYIVVERYSDAPLVGNESIQIVEQYHGALAGPEVTDAERSAGNVDYAVVMLLNAGEVQWDELAAWVDAECSGIAVGLVVADSGNEIDTPADKDTDPGDVTWQTGTTEGTGDLVEDVPAGRAVGLRVRRTTAADANPSAAQLVKVHYKATAGSDEYTGIHWGLYRIESAGLDGLRLVYLNEGSPADPLTDTPIYAGPADTFVHAGALTEGTWYLDAYRVNKYLLSSGVARQVIEVDASGEVLSDRPVSPSGVAVTVTGTDNDSLLVEAVYYPAQEAESAGEVYTKRAESWLVYYTDDGSDPALASPAVVAMASFDEATASDVVALEWETDAPMDGAPVRIRIGVRRVDAGPVNRDSALSDEVTFTAGLLGPVGPRSKIFTGGGPALYQGPTVGETDTVVIDAGEDVRIEVAPGSWSLYADTVLLMRLIWRGTGVAENGVYIPSEWDVEVSTVTPSTAADDDVFGLGTWDGSNKEVELRVRGEVVAVWDVELMLLRLHSLQVTGGGVRDLAVSGPTWARWEESLLSVWDETLERYLSVWETGTDGATAVLGNWRGTLDQAGVEGV